MSVRTGLAALGVALTFFGVGSWCSYAALHLEAGSGMAVLGWDGVRAPVFVGSSALISGLALTWWGRLGIRRNVLLIGGAGLAGFGAGLFLVAFTVYSTVGSMVSAGEVPAPVLASNGELVLPALGALLTILGAIVGLVGVLRPPTTVGNAS